VNFISLPLLLLPLLASAAPGDSLERGQAAIHSLGGCYLVDYSYTETESLKEGYQRDSRVYDVNKDKSIKEWIYVDNVSPTRLRVQHVLFGTDLQGNLLEGSVMKHTGDEWEFDAAYRYDFVGPSHWEVNREAGKGLWSRRITNLDDGLRYSCSAEWTNETFPTWACSNYAPIPGRETRDMGRRDYQTLDRFTKVVAYGNSWLERQENTKIIHQGDTRIPLAKEVGKNWYVRLPDSECEAARAFAQPRKDFWDVTREAWDETLDGNGAFQEKPYAPGQPSRYGKFLELEDQYVGRNMKDGTVRQEAKNALKELIEAFRVR
jgi:hypothetical protein